METRKFTIPINGVPDDKKEEYVRSVLSRYSRVIPNTQCFESLDNVVTHYKYTPEEITLDYLLIGFRNTLERGWDLVFDKNKMQEVPPLFYFRTVNDIIKYLETQEFNLKLFVDLLKGAMGNGYDLKELENMERKEIYDRIDGERNYQDLKWSPRRAANNTPDEEKPVAEWINYIEHHLGQAKNKVYNLDTLGATDELRKVAALAVRAMEIHGCPMRDVVADDKE